MLSYGIYIPLFLQLSLDIPALESNHHSLQNFFPVHQGFQNYLLKYVLKFTLIFNIDIMVNQFQKNTQILFQDSNVNKASMILELALNLMSINMPYSSTSWTGSKV